MKKQRIGALLLAASVAAYPLFCQKIVAVSASGVADPVGSFELKKWEFMSEAKQRAEDEFFSDIGSRVEETQGVSASLGIVEVTPADVTMGGAALSDEAYAEEMERNLEALARKHEMGRTAEAAAVQEEVQQERADSVGEILLSLEQINQALLELHERQSQPTQGALVQGERVDPSYAGTVISVVGENRVNLEGLVQSEAGGEGFVGAALVAQSIRDNMLRYGTMNVSEVKQLGKYTGSMDAVPCQDVKRAVQYVFDEGGVAVQHRVVYYYAFRSTQSDFHENQKFVVEYGGHRFFDCW